MRERQGEQRAEQALRVAGRTVLAPTIPIYSLVKVNERSAAKHAGLLESEQSCVGGRVDIHIDGDSEEWRGSGAVSGNPHWQRAVDESLVQCSAWLYGRQDAVLGESTSCHVAPLLRVACVGKVPRLR